MALSPTDGQFLRGGKDTETEDNGSRNLGENGRTRGQRQEGQVYKPRNANSSYQG